MQLDCKICGNPTQCSEDAVKVTCSHCLVQMATYFVNRKAGLFYETKPPVTGSKKRNKKSKKKA